MKSTLGKTAADITQFSQAPLKFIFLIGISNLLVACGGGGGSGDGETPPAPAASTSTVSAFITKGPITGATCNLLDINDKLVAGPATSNAGAIQFNAVSYAGDVYTVCSGGSYTDEATGSVVALTAGHVMRSVTQAIGGSSTTVNQVVTPLTELVHRGARTSGDLSSSAMAIKAIEIAEVFGLDGIDIIQIQPSPLETISGNTSDSDRYGIVLAAISQMQEDTGVAPGAPTADELFALITGIEDQINTRSFDAPKYAQSLINLTVNIRTNSNIPDAASIRNLASQYTVAGTVSGLNATVAGTAPGLSQVVILGSNGNQWMVEPNNTAFTFPPQRVSNGYDVFVVLHPATQICSVSNASGPSTGFNVSNVMVTCVDTQSPTAWWRDADGDTFGDPAGFHSGDQPDATWVTNNTDCNDGNSAIHPDAEDGTVFDLIDNDCDNVVDNGFKYAFITSETFNGNFGGLAGADAHCQRLAESVTPPLPGVYKAWLSDSNTDAKNRAAYNNTYVNRGNGNHGNLVAFGRDDLLDGSLQSPIEFDESGNTTASVFASAWTGTNPDGRKYTGQASLCADWSIEDSQTSGLVGRPRFVDGSPALDSSWTAYAVPNCSNQHHLYCIAL
jgi:hypothetical protein